jgi:hypothetical protein
MSAQERRVVHEHLQGPLRSRDLQRRRRAAPLRRRRPARLGVSATHRRSTRGSARARDGARAACAGAGSVSSVTDPPRLAGPRRDSLTGLEVEAAAQPAESPISALELAFRASAAVALPAAQVDLIESVGRKCDFHPARSPARRPGSPTPPSLTRPAPRKSPSASLREGVRRGDTPRAVGSPRDPGRRFASPLLRAGGVLVAWKGNATPTQATATSSPAPPTALTPPPAMRPEQILDVGDRAGQQAPATFTSYARSAPPHRISPGAPAWPRSDRGDDGRIVSAHHGPRLRSCEPEGRRRQDDHRVNLTALRGPPPDHRPCWSISTPSATRPSRWAPTATCTRPPMTV